MSDSNKQTSEDALTKFDEALLEEYESHSEFNKEFNVSKPLRFSSLMDENISYGYESSWVLFSCERSVYYEELDAWNSFQNESKHLPLKDLIKSNDQRSLLHELVVAAKRRRIAPFVGAGMSLDCEFPLWGKALTEILSRMDDFDDSEVKEAIKEYDYLKAAQLLWEQDDTQLRNYIRGKFAEGEIPDGEVKGAVTKLPGFCAGCVITTNFDPVLEKVFKSFEGKMHGLVPDKFAQKLIEGDSCLLKLHGHFKDEDTYVFTQEQYDKAYGDPLDFKRALPRALRQVFISHSLLFLGCSLDQDKTLELFQTVVDEKAFDIPNHFAILPEPKSGETKAQKETRLLKLKIRPIWYPNGKHEFVGLYLDLLADAVAGRVSV